MSDNKKIAIGLVLFLGLYGLVGRMDYTDALESENKALKAAAASCAKTKYVQEHEEAIFMAMNAEVNHE